MRTHTYLACLLSLCAWHTATPVAQACGGFFCSRAPVDQSAERVVFKVREDGQTDMVVQITYEGKDEDFAWVLPVAEVPENRDVFPQAALNSLDAGTAPRFQMHPECRGWEVFDAAAEGSGGGGPTSAPDDDGGVTVYVREEVGPYDVAVIGSDDPQATSQWLRDNQYNIAETMDPYIKLYTAEKMKFLALRLTADADAGDIVPFKMTLPGETPGIPLRLTTIAAEPEMGVLVWVFGDQRFGPANADEVEIDLEDLRWEPYSYGSINNWAALVAREVDKFAGRAWVAEVAGDTTDLINQIESSPIRDEDQRMQQEALLNLIGDSKYMTRLYTRLAPEEMTYDPLFKRTDAGDVDQVKQLPYVEELCTMDNPYPEPEPCDYTACGALGLCRNVTNPDTDELEASCACAPGATARTTFAPDGSVTISCQDERLSFMNPGEQTLRGERFPDPCVGFDCGEHGTCVAMNLTPTCECDQGYAARGWIDENGSRRALCVEPPEGIPDAFYNRRPTERPEDLPVGREIEVPAPSGPSDADDPLPAPEVTPASSSSGGCSTSGVGAAGAHWLWLVPGLGAIAVLRRRRRA